MTPLSRRERQIMDALHLVEEGDVEHIRERIIDPPGYDSVRTTLRILEEKGHVRRRALGRRHVYRPVQDRADALKGAWENLVAVFFKGSHEAAAATLLKASDRDLDPKVLKALLEDIDARSTETETR